VHKLDAFSKRVQKDLDWIKAQKLSLGESSISSSDALEFTNRGVSEGKSFIGHIRLLKSWPCRDGIAR